MELTSAVRAAAAVLFDEPLVQGSHGTTEDAFRKAVRLNRAPLGAIHPGSIAVSKFPTIITEVIESEGSRLRQQEQALMPVLETWSARGVLPLLAKAAGYFPYTSQNVDVLIAQEQGPVAVRAIEDLGYVEAPYLREPHKRFFKPLGKKSLPPLHLHTHLAWINIFIPGSEVLCRGIERQGVPFSLTPSGSDICLITIAHAIYEDKQITLRDLFHIHQAMATGIDVDLLRRTVRQYGWEDGWRVGCELIADSAASLQLPNFEVIREYAQRPRRTKGTSAKLPYSLSKPYAKSLHVKKTWRDQTTSCSAKAAETASLIWYSLLVKSGPFRRSRSLVVAVSGEDGSGKTTVARSLTDSLRPFAVRSRYRWLRLGSSTALEVLKVPVRRPFTFSFDRTEQGDDAGSMAMIDRASLRHLWHFLLVVDFLGRAWISLLTARLQGGFSIFDRFTEDAAVDLLVRYRAHDSRWLMRLAPAPDLSALLVADSALTSSRSATPLPEAMATRSHDSYNAWRERFDLVLDAGTMSAEELTEAIASSALARLQEPKPRPWPAVQVDHAGRHGDAR